MKKPKFISLTKFVGDYKTCDVKDLLEYIENKRFRTFLEINVAMVFPFRNYSLLLKPHSNTRFS